jgi:hypothetical protein
MANKRSPKKRRPAPKAVLRLPDLDRAKSAVLNSLSSRDAQRGYQRANSAVKPIVEGFPTIRPEYGGCQHHSSAHNVGRQFTPLVSSPGSCFSN